MRSERESARKSGRILKMNSVTKETPHLRYHLALHTNLEQHWWRRTCDSICRDQARAPAKTILAAPQLSSQKLELVHDCLDWDLERPKDLGRGQCRSF